MTSAHTPSCDGRLISDRDVRVIKNRVSDFGHVDLQPAKFSEWLYANRS